MKDSTRKFFPAFFWIFPLLLGLAFYWPTLHFGYVSWDDLSIIFDLLPHYHNLKDPFVMKDLGGLSPHYYRPIIFLSLMLSRGLGGMQPFSFHATMLLIQGLAILLVYFVTLKLTSHLPRARWVSLVSATLFALHPSHTEVISWIPALPDGWLCVFFLASFLFFLHWRESLKTGWLLLSLFSFFLALLSKESAVVLLGVLFLHDLFFPREEGKIKHCLVLSSSYGGFFLLYFFMRHFYLGTSGLPLTPGITLTKAFAQILASFGFYFREALFPLSLNPYITELSGRYYFWLGVFFLIGTCLVCGAGLYQKRGQRISFFFLFFLLTLLPTCAIAFTPVAKMVAAERYLFLPSFAPSFLIALWAVGEGKRRPLRILLVLSLLIGYGYQTVQTLPVWKDPHSFWSFAILKSPKEALPYRSLAGHYHRNREYRQALELYRKSLKAKDTLEGRATSYNSLGVVYFEMNDLENAEAAFQNAIDSNPAYLLPYCNLGSVQYEKAKNPKIPTAGKKELLGKSIEYLERCVEKNPKDLKWQEQLRSIREEREGL